MDSKTEQFSLIYDQYIGKIYRFVYLKVNSEEIAQDIVSKVFLRAWKVYSKPKSEIANIGAFLYKVAGNAVIDHYRASGRTNTVSTDSIAETADLGKNAEDKAILSADMVAIKTAILKLKKEYQDIIIWHYLDDLSVAEIAQMTKKPEGTVRVTLHRGLTALKEIIK